MPRLPIDLLPLIAEALHANQCLGTMAALAAVSRASHRAVMPILYSHVCLSNGSVLLTQLHHLVVEAANTGGSCADFYRTDAVAIDLDYPTSPFEDHSPTRAGNPAQAPTSVDIARIRNLFRHTKTLEIRTLNLLPRPSICTELPHSFRPFPSLQTLVISQHLLEALGRRKEELDITRLASEPQRPSDIVTNLPMLMEQAGFFAFLAPQKVIIDGPVDPSDEVHVLGHRTRDRPQPLISLALGRALRSLASLRDTASPVQLEIHGWRNVDFLFGLWESTAKHVSNFNMAPEAWWRWNARLVMLPPMAPDDAENWERAMSAIANTLCRIGDTRLPPEGLLEVQNVSASSHETMSPKEQVEMMHGWMDKALMAGTLFDYYPEVGTMIKGVRGQPRIACLVLGPADVSDE